MSLEKWSGTPIRNKEIAKAVLARMESAVLSRTFDKRGEKAAALTSEMTFSQFLNEYKKRHIEEDGLRSNSVDSYIEVFRASFGEEQLANLAVNPFAFEKWLKDRLEQKRWKNSTYNRYLEHGRAMFNWAKKRKLVIENPFAALEPRPENNERQVRITSEQEQKLFEACERLDSPRNSRLTKLTAEMVRDMRARAEAGEPQKEIAVAFGVSRPLVSQIVNGRIWNEGKGTLGSEMRRRLIAALDLGLRQGEMLRLQVKHVDYDTWTVKLPAKITKAATDQQVFAMTVRIQRVLKERRFLGPDAYVFGCEDGEFVASFDRSWKRLFRLAGLLVGRKRGVVWHDLRHEYGSLLIEHGATIIEAKELMRHADIRTTARYLKANDERLRELAGKMGRRVS